MAKLYERPKPLVLVIMDGVGVAPPGPGNAVTLAKTPNLDEYWPKYPHAYLKAAGEFVGLTDMADGNSEVGHMTIGTGKVLFQDLVRIDKKISDGQFMTNPVLLKAIEHVQKNNGSLHIMGLVGYGLVHSSIKHLFKLIEFVASKDIDPSKFYIHAFLDGRDSAPNAGAQAIEEIDNLLDRYRIGRIASFIGRYYAKDRDERWDRTKLAYDMLINSSGTKIVNIQKVLKDYYDKGKSDEYIAPHVIPDFEGKLAKIQPGDAVISFDFRPDRAIQLARAFMQDDFASFKREKIPNLFFATFTDYKYDLPVEIAFPQSRTIDNLGKILSENRLLQLRLAESEKFPHVTYFFDGGQKILYPGEDQVEVPSLRDVATYDRAPAMKTQKIVDVFLQRYEEYKYDFAVINFAAPDMVAHTGVLDAAVKAMEATDDALSRIVKFVLKENGLVIITADHGNCEELVDIRTGEIDTKHSNNDVPFLIVGKGIENREIQMGTLADIAPTILYLLGLEKPDEMTGRSLLI